MWFIFRSIKFTLGISFLLTFCQSSYALPCNYETWDWDTVQKKSVNHRKVKKSKSELDQAERGKTPGCSVCEEDQVEIHIESLPTFKVCKKLEEKITRSIRIAYSKGFPFESIVGYRVGKSKGPLNSFGQRTEFSNHSFGTAIDFNSEKNGLYDFCIRFGPDCKLLRGGLYKENVPGSITRESAIYQALTDEGMKWGGEMSGKQKDFMHFSLNGM